MTREHSSPERHEVTGAPEVEVLVLCADRRGIRRLRLASGTLRLRGEWSDHPTLSVRRSVERLGLTPRLVHSTSWRYEDGGGVLTYVVVVDSPADMTPALKDEAVVPVALARGEALEPPRTITSDQVLEHTIRHLAWLVREDPAARDALADWVPFLEGAGLNRSGRSTQMRPQTQPERNPEP